ncbi:MAG: hypothetical protein ABL961_10820 [Vicinamibacterales bacterium]
MRTSATLLILSLALSLGAPSSAQSIGAPSLADVATKNREAQRKGAKPPKVYSNDDLRPVPAPPSAAAPANTPTTDPTVQSTPAAPDVAAAEHAAAPEQKPSDTKDRAYWSKRIAAAREQLDRDRVLAEALQSRINALTADFTNRDDPAQRDKVAVDRQKALDELDRTKKALAADQQAIPAIEEEARRAGVPPGWLR